MTSTYRMPENIATMLQFLAYVIIQDEADGTTWGV